MLVDKPTNHNVSQQSNPSQMYLENLTNHANAGRVSLIIPMVVDNITNHTNSSQ